ncbi:YheC/YheD family protein [Cohnella mopanensis]|uniref:YheC/YheD family protein n=1 Tax=Cohnella mopanensis TaxID=2911966 RepID=UPI0021037C2E|nr:YheC/YheD family protein [Cohnella mopanensis]
MEDPIMKHYVPDTEWFDSSSLRRMLRNYARIYIKPDVGRKGNGIIRLKRLNAEEFEISYKDTKTLCSRDKVYSAIKELQNPDKEYIIQRGIDLATYRRRPFDVRVVLQKPEGKWRATLMCAKLAPRRSSVVTNVSKGAKDYNLYRLLKGTDQRLNRSEIIRELIDASQQIAQILGSRFPLKILGLDMGIDKRGNIWFIEANTKPDCKGLEKIDRGLYRKYLRAKKIMRNG